LKTDKWCLFINVWRLIDWLIDWFINDWFRPTFFYFLIFGSADPNFWRNEIKIKETTVSFIFLLSADLMNSLLWKKFSRNLSDNYFRLVYDIFNQLTQTLVLYKLTDDHAISICKSVFYWLVIYCMPNENNRSSWRNSFWT